LRNPQRILPSLAALFVLSLAGCGDSNRMPTYTVSGTVTFRGEPLEGACVMFIPAQGRPASGKTDAGGRFTLLSYAAGDGAIAGEHTVCIARYVADPADKSGSPYQRTINALPAKYATPLQSPLRATITKLGPNEFSFDIHD
jgi:hypothetical protein